MTLIDNLIIPIFQNSQIYFKIPEYRKNTDVVSFCTCNITWDPIKDYQNIPIFRYSNIREFRNIGISGYSDIPIFRKSGILEYRNIRISVYSDIPIFRASGMSECSSIPIIRNSRILECRNIRILEYQNMGVFRYPDIPII